MRVEWMTASDCCLYGTNSKTFNEDLKCINKSFLYVSWLNDFCVYDTNRNWAVVEFCSSVTKNRIHDQQSY